MIQYIYFVKCPNCDDEPFDFFNDAKSFALECLGSKPVISQVEVKRNDFGECIDSKDLGTIWSWEDEVNVSADEPEEAVFTKGDFAKYNPESDPEFDALDNSLDFVPDNFRKPIPAGMTLEELVEEMEENEDTVECTWCEELFDKSECRYEVDLGWLCSRCEAAIKSRGETLTFRENNYWDFLDESAELDEAGNSKYSFKYLVYNENAEADIYAKLDMHPETFKYVYRTSLSVPLMITDTLPYPPYKTVSKKAGVITGFKINGSLINFIIEDNNGRTYEQDFKTLMSRAYKGGVTQVFLNNFYQIVTEVNKESNRGVSGNRDFNAYVSVKDDPAAAEELRSHIVKVQYDIPCADYTIEDLMSEDTTEADAEKAVANLAKIKSKFFDEWKYGYAADEAGLVNDRPIYNNNGDLRDTVYYIATEWHAVGKITFDCRVDQLSEAAQNLIRSAKVTGNFDNIKNKKEIDCIRLAFALTEYFDDVKFYETKTIPDTSISYTVDDEEKELLTAGLDSSVLKENLDSDSITWICNFNGKEIGTVEASTEDEALEKMQQEYPEYNYGEYDGCFEVFPAVDVF